MSESMEVDNNLAEEFQNLSKGTAEFSKKCTILIQEIKSGQLTIVHLVEQLGTLLVDVSPSKRELGTWILTQVLEGLPLSHFDQKQLEFICAFYTDRLKDHHQVIPAVLAGFVALSKFSRFPEGAAVKFLEALFHNVSCQQQQEQDRHNIYKIFKSLLNRCTSEICAMGYDFVYGVISAVDGERNPKNLVLLFNWFPKFFKTVTLGHLTEEAFEVLACYFPVDFKTPTNDATAISRDQLANYLAPCLTAIPQFAEFCFPLALEKLDSSLEIAKMDSLKLLEIGCSSFDVSSYVQHITEIWSQIQKEVFSSRNSMIEKACLSTLTSVIKKISNDPSINITVKDISDTIKGNLLPDSKLFDQSSKILLSIAAASSTSCDLIVKEITPILINIFDMSTTSSHKALILRNLIHFFNVYVTFHEDVEFEELGKIQILCLKASLDEDNELKKIAFDGLGQTSKFLTKDVRFSLYDNLQNLLLLPQSGDVKHPILLCFKELAKKFPSEVQVLLVDNSRIHSEQMLETYLYSISVIVDLDYFTEIVINIFLNFLRKTINVAKVVTSSLKSLVQNYENNEKIEKKLLEMDIISVLVGWSIENEDNLDFKSLENVASILKTVIGRQESEIQKEIVSKHLPIELRKPRRVFLVDGLLCHLRRDVKVEKSILVSNLFHIVKTESGPGKNTAAQLLGNLLNKWADENELNSFLKHHCDNLIDLTLRAWITKALVMRNHCSAEHWICCLLALLEHNKNVAVCFRVIMDNNVDCLSSKSFCVRSLLYQQKFFTIVTDKLREKPELDSHILAFGYLLEKAPRQVILLQFKKILKLVIISLDKCEEAEILIVMLQIIKDFVVSNETCIEDNLSDFLTRFLKLSMFDKSMKVRVLALQCLQESTSNFPVYKLLLQKQEVLQILGKVIDDKKRIVRREAVEARALWFILDAPI